MEGHFAVVAELVPLLRHDLERRDELSQLSREVVDLGRGHLAPGEDAEVHAHLERRTLVLAHAEGDRRVHQVSLGSHRNFNAATATPATPQAARTPIAVPCDQNECLCSYTAFDRSTRYLSGSTSPTARTRPSGTPSAAR